MNPALFFFNQNLFFIGKNYRMVSFGYILTTANTVPKMRKKEKNFLKYENMIKFKAI